MSNQNNQRVQTRGIGLLDLQPTAKPVDQFAAPEVRRDLGGSDLGQIAQALGQLEPKLFSLAYARTEAEDQRQLRQIPGLIESQQIENQQKLKEAADQGKIPYSSNPWFMHALKVQVAHKEAGDNFTQALNAYAQSDQYHSDSPQAVRDYFAKQLAPTKQNADPTTAAAMQEVYDQNVDRLVTQHVMRRVGERADEMRTAVGTNINRLGSVFTPDDANALNAEALKTDDPRAAGVEESRSAAQQKLTTVTAKLQQYLDGMGKVMGKDDLTRTAQQAVLDLGLSSRSDKVAHVLLDNLTIGGERLSVIGDASARLSTLSNRVIEIRAAEDQQAVQQHSKAMFDARNLLARMVADRLKVAKEITPDAIAQAYTFTPDDLDKLGVPPEIRTVLVQEAAGEIAAQRAVTDPANRRTTQSVLQDTAAALTQPGVTQEQAQGIVLKSFAKLYAINPDATRDLSAMLGDIRAGMNMAEPRDDEAFANGLRVDVLTGKASEDQIVSALRAGKITRQTFGNLIDASRANSGETAQVYRQLEEDLSHRITAAFNERAGTPQQEHWDADTRNLHYQKLTGALDTMQASALGIMADPSRNKDEKIAALRDLAKDIGERVKAQPIRERDQAIGLIPMPQPQPIVQQLQKPRDSKSVPLQSGKDDIVATATRSDPRIGQIQDAHLNVFRRLMTEGTRMVGNIPDEYSQRENLRQAYENEDAVSPTRSQMLRDFRAQWHWGMRQYLNPVTQSGAQYTGIALYDKTTGQLVRRTTVDLAHDAQQAEMDLRDSARAELEMRGKRLDAMGNGIGAQAYFTQQLQAFAERGGKGTTAQFGELMRTYNAIKQYADVRSLVGYTVDEVHALGPAAWQDHQIYANEMELDQKGPEDAARLGIRGKENYDKFYTAQANMIQANRDEQNVIHKERDKEHLGLLYYLTP